jgi:hypothetical protein
MKRMGVAVVAAVVFWPFLTVALSLDGFFRLEDVRPGMKGIGKTCYQGSKPEEFQVEILGIMRGVGAGADAVLARFSGGPLDRTGVFEGMSGSPVYIDGKLLGAVAFSYEFSKEAIGGITPISEMIDAFGSSEAALPSNPKIILKKSTLWDYKDALTPDSKWNTTWPSSWLSALLQSAQTPFGGHALIPIATPLSTSGFSAEALRAFEPGFRSLGLSLLQGSGAAAARLATSPKADSSDNVPLEPGSNLVVSLVRGDLDVSAAGTVTYIDGQRLYAFGHMLFDLGNTNLPMHKGRTLTVFPGLQSSFKIVETGDAIGTIHQDRSPGIYGVVGQNAKMIPLSVDITTSRGIKKSLNFEIAHDRFLAPLLVNLTVYDSIIASERAMGMQTLDVKGTINIKGQDPVKIENRFSSGSEASSYASLSIAAPVNFLLASGFKDLDVEKISITIESQEDDRAAVLDAIRLDGTEFKAGETANVDVLYRKADGEVVRDSYPVKLPTDLPPGRLSVLVADGTTLMTIDAKEQGDDVAPRDLNQLIKYINSIRGNDHLYLRLYRKEAGAVVKGEGMPGLPPSILSILKSERSAGGLSAIQTSPYMEYELPSSDYVITGSKTLTVSIQP